MKTLWNEKTEFGNVVKESDIKCFVQLKMKVCELPSLRMDKGFTIEQNWNNLSDNQSTMYFSYFRKLYKKIRAYLWYSNIKEIYKVDENLHSDGTTKLLCASPEWLKKRGA